MPGQAGQPLACLSPCSLVAHWRGQPLHWRVCLLDPLLPIFTFHVYCHLLNFPERRKAADLEKQQDDGRQTQQENQRGSLLVLSWCSAIHLVCITISRQISKSTNSPIFGNVQCTHGSKCQIKLVYFKINVCMPVPVCHMPPTMNC